MAHRHTFSKAKFKLIITKESEKKMSNEMECMCLECGVSIHMPEDLIAMDPSDSDSKLLDSLLVCEQCGGALRLVGKAGDELFYRLK